MFSRKQGSIEVHVILTFAELTFHRHKVGLLRWHISTLVLAAIEKLIF